MLGKHSSNISLDNHQLIERPSTEFQQKNLLIGFTPAFGEAWIPDKLWEIGKRCKEI
jgi:hypothetical protein